MTASELQATDIVLNGAGYMLAPRKGRDEYTRSQDGMSEGRTGRITQRDFFGGQHRAYQLERDRSWDAVGVGPAYGGQGIEPWPHIRQLALTSTTPLTSALRRNPSAVIRDYVYFAVAEKLYRTQPISGTSWQTPNTMYTAPAPITSIAYYGGNILIGMGSANEILHLVYPGATSPAVLFAGERAHEIISYGGFAMWSDARTDTSVAPQRIMQVTGSGLEFKLLDSPIRRLTVAQSKAIAATSVGLYDFTGRVNEVDVRNPAYNPNDANETDPPTIRALRWFGEFDPFFQHGALVDQDDYAFIASFGGRLYAWVGKQVMEWNPSGERAGWRATGLEGRGCYGGCVAAGHLVVCIESRDGQSEVWAWNGAGWWLLIAQPISNNRFCWPINVAGIGGYDVMLFRQGTTEAHLIRLVWRSDTDNTYPFDGNAAFITSMIDAGERDKSKAWRKVGCVFAAPEKRGAVASDDPLNVWLDYSIDGGGTWTNVASRSVVGNYFTQHNVTLDADIASDAAVSRFLQLRVRWSSVLNWAPVLTGVWSEFEVLDSPARRRRWQFTVTAQDQVIDRAGTEAHPHRPAARRRALERLAGRHDASVPGSRLRRRSHRAEGPHRRHPRGRAGPIRRRPLGSFRCGVDTGGGIDRDADPHGPDRRRWEAARAVVAGPCHGSGAGARPLRAIMAHEQMRSSEGRAVAREWLPASSLLPALRSPRHGPALVRRRGGDASLPW